MQDRVSLYPGRVKLVSVAGQENTYDMVRADSPTQEGAPLNKATFLKDATAALYGLSNEAVPDDVLSVIKGLLNNNTNAITQLEASRAKIETGSYAGTGSKDKTLTFSFVPKIVIIYGGVDNSSAYYTCESLMIVPCFGLRSEGIIYASFWGGGGSDLGPNQYTTISLSGSTLTLSVSAKYAMNESSWTYRYIAFA